MPASVFRSNSQQSACAVALCHDHISLLVIRSVRLDCSFHITPTCIQSDLVNLPFSSIQAPSEAEAQCAELARGGKVGKNCIFLPALCHFVHQPCFFFTFGPKLVWGLIPNINTQSHRPAPVRFNSARHGCVSPGSLYYPIPRALSLGIFRWFGALGTTSTITLFLPSIKPNGMESILLFI